MLSDASDLVSCFFGLSLDKAAAQEFEGGTDSLVTELVALVVVVEAVEAFDLSVFSFFL